MGTPENSTATVIRMDNDEQQVVAESAELDHQGEVKVPITEAGYYEIQVDGPGYISTRQSLSVDCHPADCDTCAPSIMIPLSPVLGENQLRLTLGGENNLENLALYAVYRDSMISCITTPDQTTDCTGIERVTGANGQGVETITFNSSSVHHLLGMDRTSRSGRRNTGWNNSFC